MTEDRGQRTEDRVCFNPRPRVGGDIMSMLQQVIFVVSIHAPAWGATGTPDFGPAPNQVSIHAPAWGATYFTDGTAGLLTFQSTPPRGGRLTSSCPRVEALEFQSTPPRGGRQPEAVRLTPLDRVSIHAPAWGATVNP